MTGLLMAISIVFIVIQILIIANCFRKIKLNFIMTFIRAVVTEEGSCAPKTVLILYYLKDRGLLGFYCRASTVYNIMLLALKFKYFEK